MVNIGRHRFMLLLTFALGCGDQRGSDHEPVDAGPERVIDATAAADEPDDAEQSAAPEANDAPIEPPGSPPAGECGVVRRIALPAIGDVVRVPHGFVVGPEVDLGTAVNAVRWLAISEDGRRREPYTGTSSPSLSLAMLPVGSDPFAGRVVNVTASLSDSQGLIAAESIADGAVGVPHSLGAAFYRGTIQKAAAVSLDGLRAVYVTGHVAVDVPHAFVIDERAAGVGDVLPLSDHERPLFSCLQASPTAHGAVVSIIDSEGPVPVLRLIEIGGQVTALQDVTMELASTRSCPVVQLTEHGLWVSVPASEQTFDLLAVNAGQVTVRQSGLALAPRWIGQTESGELLYLIAHDTDGWRLARKDSSNAWVFVAGDYPALGAVIPSEPGRLFVTSAPASDAREILEIACGQLTPLSRSE